MRAPKAKEKSVTIVGTELFSGVENTKDTSNIKAYRNSLYFYIAASKIAKRAAGVPLNLYKIKNKRGDVTEVLDHPLLALLARPNERQTAREFRELSTIYYLTTGDCFWYLDLDGTTPKAIEILRPDLVEVLLSADKKTIIGYEYHASTIQRFTPEQIIHVKNVDPENPLRGQGPVRPATSRILTESQATEYQANFFKNQGRPDLAVFSNAEEVSEEAAQDFRSRWKRVFGGKNAGNVGVFGSIIKDVKELNKTPKEMDFIETQKFLRDDILAALHVPKAMVTTDDVNLANAKVAYRMFLQEAVVPVLEAFVDILNNRLAMMVDYTVFFDFDDPVPADRETLLAEHTAGVGKWITQNEARIETGRAPLEGEQYDQLGNVTVTQPATPPAVQETAKAILRTRPVLVKRLEAIEKTVEAVRVSTEPKRSMTSVFPTRALKEAYAKAYLKKVDQKAETLKEAIDKVHLALEKRILDTDLSVGGFMNAAEEAKIAKDALTPLAVQMYKESGQEALDALFKKADDQFFTDQVMLASIEGRVEFFTKSMMDTTFNILKAKIVEGVQRGEGVEAIADTIRSYFVDMPEKRARTIAQTESNYILSKSTNDAYSQSSVVTGKEWLSIGDDRVREEHVANEAQGPIPKNAAFSNGEQYPAEHSVNCRCVLLPAV